MAIINKYLAYKNIESLVVGKNAFNTDVYTMSIRCQYKNKERVVEEGVLNFYYFDWENEMYKVCDDVEKKKKILKKIKEDKIPGSENMLIKRGVLVMLE